MATSDAFLPFSSLVDELRHHGFVIGVQHHLRLRELLHRIAGNCTPEDLKTILCPIFATSREQQERFYEIFDWHYPAFSAAASRSDQKRGIEDPIPGITEVTRRRKRRWAAWLSGIAAALLLSALTILALPWLLGSSGVVPRQADRARSGKVGPALSRPTPEDRGGPWSPRGTARAAVVILPILAFLANEYRLFRRRHLLVQRWRQRRPPLDWPVRAVSRKGPFDASQNLRPTARLLRERVASGTRRLAVRETIAATIAAAGHPSLRFRNEQQTPEYLLFIERASNRDHLSRHFQSLAQTLHREGVFVTCYYHSGDPRVCYSEATDDPVLLSEIRDRHPDHRALLFGTGNGLVDGLTGRLHDWVSGLVSWRDRAFFTPEDPSRWQVRELALSRHFVLLPATVHGLRAFVESRGGTGGTGATAAGRERGWTGASPSRAQEVPSELRSEFGPDLYRWLCACAVFPDLHWDLTLRLGALPEIGSDLINEENLCRLIRLPWFREGRIPDALREVLVSELSEPQDRAVRKTIIDVLEQNPPPNESIAARRHELNLVVQGLGLALKDPGERKLALRALDRLPAHEITRDLATVRLLEHIPAKGLAFILPKRLRRVFYAHGLPPMGTRWLARAGFFAALMVFGLIGVGAWRAPSSIESTMGPASAGGAVANSTGVGLQPTEVVGSQLPGAPAPISEQPADSAGLVSRSGPADSANVIVHVEPYAATISVDGSVVATNRALYRTHLEAGRHVIVVRHPVLGSREWSLQIRQRGGVYSLHQDFLERTGTIEIVSAPTWGDIYLDGVRIGHATPYRMTGIPPGDHDVSLVREGYTVDGGPQRVHFGIRDTVRVFFRLLPDKK